ncbi:hypothetical protein DIPPA_02341 [Diplonema papillatum]|nr:hypothetical protein DIPPA_02341 [Diplonema papillatum]
MDADARKEDTRRRRHSRKKDAQRALVFDRLDEPRVTPYAAARSAGAGTALLKALLAGAPRDGRIPAEEHRAALRTLAAAHEKEIEEGDRLHAIACADLLEEDGASRAPTAQSGARRRSSTFRSSSSTRPSRPFSSDHRHLSNHIRALSIAIPPVDDLQEDALLLEVSRLRAEVAGLYCVAKEQEAEHAGAYAALKKEKGKAEARGASLAARVQQATGDYRELERDYGAAMQQVNLGKAKYAALAAEAAAGRQAISAAAAEARRLQELFSETGGELVCSFFVTAIRRVSP